MPWRLPERAMSWAPSPKQFSLQCRISSFGGVSSQHVAGLQAPPRHRMLEGSVSALASKPSGHVKELQSGSVVVGGLVVVGSSQQSSVSTCGLQGVPEQEWLVGSGLGSRGAGQASVLQSAGTGSGACSQQVSVSSGPHSVVLQTRSGASGLRTLPSGQVMVLHSAGGTAGAMSCSPEGSQQVSRSLAAVQILLAQKRPEGPGLEMYSSGHLNSAQFCTISQQVFMSSQSRHTVPLHLIACAFITCTRSSGQIMVLQRAGGTSGGGGVVVVGSASQQVRRSSRTSHSTLEQSRLVGFLTSMYNSGQAKLSQLALMAQHFSVSTSWQTGPSQCSSDMPSFGTMPSGQV
mmetsp:Transcript_50956/g.163077  ORF Transcript_50956/g.163077 Transcript_50956/m.163077 type:complete len:347 (+) Transcript_50956:1102-2142(+)